MSAAFLTAGILQPASYSPVRTSISAMGGQAGTDRRVMTGGIFLVSGCYLVTAAGLAAGGSGGVKDGLPRSPGSAAAGRTEVRAPLTARAPAW